MIRILVLVTVILVGFLIFWITSRVPLGRFRVDFFCIANIGFYFALLASVYIFLANEKIGLFSALTSLGVIVLRKYFYGRWI